MENNPCVNIKMLSNVQITILFSKNRYSFHSYSIWELIFFFELGKNSNIHMEFQGHQRAKIVFQMCVTILGETYRPCHRLEKQETNPLFNFYLLSDRSAKTDHWAKNRFKKWHCKTLTSHAESWRWTWPHTIHRR